MLAPPSSVSGARRGFATDPTRVAEEDQYAMFRRVGVESVRLWAVGEPLPAEACRVRLEAELPAVLEVDGEVEVACVVENLGGAILVTAPPYPVCLSDKWLDRESGQPVAGREAVRSSLPRSLPPRDAAACRVKVKAPPVAGEFILRLTLVQAHVAWFDNLHHANACSARVRIVV